MVQVNVEQGILEGETLTSSLGEKYFSFKGIPYAAPPVGDLRFKAPQPPTSWNGVRSANTHGPVCYQFNLFTKTIVEGSEDCLYLNVYSPKLKPSKPLPVMFWIHGGAYMSGSGNCNMYGPDFLIHHGVIVVTINYRLEVLGFLCLNSEDVPGNAGMKDQVAALRWVHKNIHSFGGDPKNITIFGESAGASSVSYHLLSPMSKGLFKRAILQSGSCVSRRTRVFEPRQRAKELARQLGFHSDDNKELYNFFKNAPIKSLVKTNVPIIMAEEQHLQLHFYFSVVDEKKFGNNERFFFGDVFNKLRNEIDDGLEILVGYTRDEGYLSFANKSLTEIVFKFTKYLESFVPMSLVIDCPVSKQLEIGRRVKEFYFGNSKITESNLGPLVRYFSWCSFNFDVMQWVRFYSKKKNNRIFLYKFSCFSERNIMSRLIGVKKDIVGRPVVCHTDDLMYLFDAKMINVPVDKGSKSFKMIQNTTTLWTNFAKFGNPTPDRSLAVNWEPYTMEKQDYLYIGEDLVIGNSPDKEELQFWENIFKEYLPNHVAY